MINNWTGGLVMGGVGWGGVPTLAYIGIFTDIPQAHNAQKITGFTSTSQTVVFFVKTRQLRCITGFMLSIYKTKLHYEPLDTGWLAGNKSTCRS